MHHEARHILFDMFPPEKDSLLFIYLYRGCFARITYQAGLYPIAFWL